ncbi:MAG: hypothetical protein ABI623_01850, partial [bacterium]
MTSIVRLRMFLTFAVLLFLSGLASAQNADWTKMSDNKNVNFYQIQQDFNRYWQGKTIERGKGYKPFKRWEAYMEPRVYPSGDLTLPLQTYTNFAAWQQANTGRYNSAAVSNWTELGPIGTPSGPSPYSR